jgi:hypothetical protein
VRFSHTTRPIIRYEEKEKEKKTNYSSPAPPARNDLEVFRRKPSDLIRYIAWSNKIKAEYGSITNYICRERLRWHNPEPNLATATVDAEKSDVVVDSAPVIPFKNPVPFADPADFKILRNDWPYGVTEGITHLVVWSKTPIAVKPETGDVTDESRALIEDFVARTFVARLQRDPRFGDEAGNCVLWFKNWAALQSVRSLEHVHVLVRDVPEDIITEWTGEEGVVR